ncbi:MAG: Rep family protein, partial [Rickettsia endosymbiont of Ixodes persulcatus]|nr:Rep family protein [Rickettsia endosymbiont of Ixodes persulcatus]
QKVGSSKGMVRYFIHMDNPEKYQYSIDDVVGHNGADIASYFELSATNRLTIMKDIVSYIYDNRIDNFADFLMLCIQENDDWFNVAVNSNTLAINKMLDAIWHKKQNKYNK